jgi:hypothetical protein
MFIGKINVIIPTFQRELQLSITIDSFQRALDGYDIKYYMILLVIK